MNKFYFKPGHKEKLKNGGKCQITLIKGDRRVMKKLVKYTPVSTGILEIIHQYVFEEFNISCRVQHLVRNKYFRMICLIEMKNHFSLSLKLRRSGKIDIIMWYIAKCILKYDHSEYLYSDYFQDSLEYIMDEYDPVHYGEEKQHNYCVNGYQFSCYKYDYEDVLNNIYDAFYGNLQTIEDGLCANITKSHDFNMRIGKQITSSNNINCLNPFFNKYMIKQYDKKSYFDEDYHLSFGCYVNHSTDSDCYVQRISAYIYDSTNMHVADECKHNAEHNRILPYFPSDYYMYLIIKPCNHKLLLQMILITKVFCNVMRNINEKN